MKIGAYEHSDILEFVRYDKDGRKWNSPYFVTLLDCIEPAYSYHAGYIKQDLLLHFPLPTKECFKEQYEIGDKVYYQTYSNNIFHIGTIERKREDRYIVNNIHSRMAEQLLPYHYYILHSNCRLAIHWWLLCAKRCGIYKDIRKLIGSYIWRLRNEYEWECNHKHTRKRMAHKRIKYTE